MGGITSGTGLISGINSRSLIDQLIGVEARPRAQVQRRVAQLQFQRAAYLDLNSRLSALQSAARSFRTGNTFQTKAATSSDENILKATASNTASPGSYTFIVDRLVSNQQMLSRGFTNRDTAGAGLTKITFESTKARLDTNVALADLNDGQGVQRGKIVITDSASRSATVDLSRALTVDDVLEAINGNGTARVSASVEGGRLIVRDQANGALSISDASGYTTATSLGIAGSATGAINGSVIYKLNRNTALSALNDGNGVNIRSAVGENAFNFQISVDNGTETTLNINVGDVWEDVSGTLTKTQGAVTTVGGVVDRINSAVQSAGLSATVRAEIDQTNGKLVIRDLSGTATISVTDGTGNTAADLGLTQAPTGSDIIGRRLFAGLNTTLVGGINGGAGITGSGKLYITARDGTAATVDVTNQSSFNDLFKAISTATGGKVQAALGSNGTGIVLTDSTGGSGNLIITGDSGSDTAASLGISTGNAGVAAASVTSTKLQRQYISRSTAVTSLNGNAGIGTGVFRITDSLGAVATVDIGTDSATLGDIIDEINSKGLRAKARINSNGGGLELYEDLTGGLSPGGVKMKVEDESGAVAKGLNILGTASGTGTDNKINGSYERVITLSAADTLDSIVTKVNAANAGATMSVVRDGVGTTPFRLALASTGTGESGRFVIDTEGGDLGLTTLDRGNDARVFFGSTDAARGLAVSSSRNQVDGLVPGVRVDLKNASASPVTLSVSSDSSAIETAVGVFVKTFNTAIERIKFQTRFIAESDTRGPLLGDSTALQMRSALFREVQAPIQGASGRFTRLSDVGITVGQGAELKFDEARFRNAMAEDPAAVQALFDARETADDSVIDLGDGVTVRNVNAGQTFTRLGVMGRIENLAEQYINRDNGLLIRRETSVDQQIQLNNSRITAMTTRLESRRAVLESQFAAMEKTLARLQSQQSSLSSLSSLGG